MDRAGIALRAVRVRPVRPEEVPRWNALMRERHYLGFTKFCGPQLKQVAVLGERWLALLGWQAAALHCGPRDRWIGWTPLQRRTRLFLVAQQARFLLLHEAGRAPCLASRVQGLSLRRLARDWRRQSGRTVLLAETFVDEARFAGTCYRAANWIAVGRTQGYGRVREGRLGYAWHGRRKRVFVYPLRADARERLAAVAADPAWQGKRHRMRLRPKQLESLWNHLRKVPDFRQPKGLRHPLPTVLGIVLAARLAGKSEVRQIAIFARRLTQVQLRRLGARVSRRLQRRVAPSQNTIRRVLAGMDAARLEREMDAWLAEQSREQSPGEPLGLDGKHLRGSYDRDRGADGELLDEPAQQQLTVAGLESRQPHAQQGFKGARNDTEPTVARAVLQHIDIRGRCILADALHTQRKTAQTIRDLGGHYLFQIKGSQPTLLQQLRDYDWSQCPEHVETTHGHGRIDVRRIRVAADVGRSSGGLNFPDAHVAAQLTQQTTCRKTGEAGKPHTVCLLTGMGPEQATGPELIRLRRAYWAATENGVHRVRDGAWREDAQRARKQNLPRVLAAFANLAPAILRMANCRNIKEALEELSYSPRAALALAAPY